MATLPRADIPQAPQNVRRGIRTVEASGNDPVAGVLHDVGSQIETLAKRARDAEIAAEVTKAKIKLDLDLDRTASEIERDNLIHPDNFRSEFEKRSRKVIEQAGAGMTSGMHKRAWESITTETLPAYQQRIERSEIGRRVDRAKASMLESGAQISEIAKDPAVTQEAMLRSAADHRSLLKAQYDGGNISDSQYQAQLLALDNDVKAGTSLRHLTNVDSLLTAGRYGEAEAYMKSAYDEIDPADRARAERAVELQSLEGRAIQKADELFASGSYADAMKGAASIDNPKERLAVESRITDLARQQEAARDTEQRAVQDELHMHILNGGGLSNAPTELLRKADAKTLSFIEDELYQRQQRAAASASMSAAERAELKAISAISKNTIMTYAIEDEQAFLTGPENWADTAPHLNALYQAMEPVERSALMLEVAKRRKEGSKAVSSDSVDGIVKDLVAGIQFAAPEKMRGKDFDGASKSRSRAKAEEDAIRGLLYGYAQDHAARSGGKPLTAQDRDVLIAKAFRAYDANRYPMKEGSDPGSFIKSITKGLPVNAQQMSYLKGQLHTKLGREPTDEEVKAAMAQVMGAK